LGSLFVFHLRTAPNTSAEKFSFPAKGSQSKMGAFFAFVDSLESLIARIQPKSKYQKEFSNNIDLQRAKFDANEIS